MDKDLVYELVIFRIDSRHISVLKSKEFGVVKNEWRRLTDLWKDCISKKIPFELESPIITSFDPGTIREITIEAIPESSESRLDSSNPYVRQMRYKGLGDTLRYIDSEILDGGYK